MQTFARNMTPDRLKKKKSHTSLTKPSTPKTYLDRGKHAYIYLVGILLNETYIFRRNYQLADLLLVDAVLKELSFQGLPWNGTTHHSLKKTSTHLVVSDVNSSGMQQESCNWISASRQLSKVISGKIKLRHKQMHVSKLF